MHIWNRAPALLYGLTLLLGLFFALSSPWALLPFGLLACTAYKRLFSLTLIFLSALPWMQLVYHFPSSGPGEGRFVIESLSHYHLWYYRGKLNHIPVCISSKEYHPPNCHYHLKGVWTTPNSFTATEWIPTSSFCLTAERLHLKKAIRTWLEAHTSHTRAARFLGGLITGELEDPVMCKEFTCLGLSHLLAISGFHFALLVLGLHGVLRFFLPRRVELLALIVCMTLYYLLIGNNASVQRAWIFMLLYLMGELLEKRTYALNILGAALLVALVCNPLTCLTLSFQLSFLATAGLLLFARPLERALQVVFPKLPLYDVTRHSALVQYGYLFVAFFKELLALTVAVHSVLLPLMLFHFHLFLPQSLLYNLFFPMLTSFALFLLPLYPLSTLYTELLLKLTENPPILFPALYVEQMPVWGVTLCLSVALLGGVWLEERRLSWY